MACMQVFTLCPRRTAFALATATAPILTAPPASASPARPPNPHRPQRAMRPYSLPLHAARCLLAQIRGSSEQFRRARPRGAAYRSGAGGAPSLGAARVHGASALGGENPEERPSCTGRRECPPPSGTRAALWQPSPPLLEGTASPRGTGSARLESEGHVHVRHGASVGHGTYMREHVHVPRGARRGATA